MNDLSQSSAPDPAESPDEASGIEHVKKVIEGALLAAAEPLSLNQLNGLFEPDEQPGHGLLRQALAALDADCSERAVELNEVGSGYRLQVRSNLMPWISRLWSEKPQRYSRALLETLAIIAYRQPITRGEIEQIRGVSVSSSILRTLQEREWVRTVGHRDVPGRPELLGTTKAFLDYFNLKSLDELPTLAEIKDLDNLEPELELTEPPGADTAPDEKARHEIQEDEPQDRSDEPQDRAPEDRAPEESGQDRSGRVESARAEKEGSDKQNDEPDRPDRYEAHDPEYRPDGESGNGKTPEGGQESREPEDAETPQGRDRQV